MNLVRVQLLGTPGLTIGQQQISGIQRKNFALLSLLVLNRHRPVSRETLSGTIWPDSPEEQARASLRQALSALRRQMNADADVIETIGDTISLNPNVTSSDVHDFSNLVDKTSPEDQERAVAAYFGDLLEGFGPVSPEFDRWIDAERASLRSHFGAALLRLSDFYEDVGRTDDVIAAAQRLIAMDPLQEHVHRRLMRAFFRIGRHDAALKQFDSLKSILANELGVQPEKPTLELLSEVRKARLSGSARVAAPKQKDANLEAMIAPARPSIGVLKFKGLPEGGNATLLGEGISEDLTIELSRQPDLLVVSRQSSIQVDETRETAEAIGKALGIRFLLSGSVRLFGDKVRVAAHLVSCETGREVWAERFDRQIEDFFEIQTEIARTVSATAADRIAAEIVGTTQKASTEDLEAYQLVLRGINELHRFSEEGYRQAEMLFQKAVDQSDVYGRAFAWLAMTKLYLMWNIDVSIDVSEIVPLAERAISLDPTEPKGHCALAITQFIQRRYEQAEFSFQSALRANPNDDLVLTEYGRFLMYLDRSEEGLRRIREAMRINPFHPQWLYSIQGRCLHTLKRYEEAISAFERVSNPPFYIHAYLAACYAQVGEENARRASKVQLYEAKPDFELNAFLSIFPYKNAETAASFAKSFEAGLA